MINVLRTIAGDCGMVVAVTNSRRNGNFIESIRVYASADDKGKPDRALFATADMSGLQEIIREVNMIRGAFSRKTTEGGAES